MPNWCSNKLKIKTKTAEDMAVVKSQLGFYKNAEANKKDINDFNVDFNIAVPMPEEFMGYDRLISLRVNYGNSNPEKFTIKRFDYDRIGKLNPSEFLEKTKLYDLSESVLADIESSLALCPDDTPVEDFIEVLFRKSLAGKEFDIPEESVENLLTPMITDNTNYCKANYGFADWYEWRVEKWGTKWNAITDYTEEDVESNEICIDFSTAWSAPYVWLAEFQNKLRNDLDIELLEFSLHYTEFGNWIGGYYEIDDDGFLSHYNYNEDEMQKAYEECSEEDEVFLVMPK